LYLGLDIGCGELIEGRPPAPIAPVPTYPFSLILFDLVPQRTGSERNGLKPPNQMIAERYEFKWRVRAGCADKGFAE
jgi:hypothetical protein